MVELPAVVFFIGLLTLIARSNVLGAEWRNRPSQTAGDAKTAVAQTMVYALHQNLYPASLWALRSSGVASVTPIRGKSLCNLHRTCLAHPPGGEAYRYSNVADGIGVSSIHLTPNTGLGGSIGCSSRDWGVDRLRDTRIAHVPFLFRPTCGGQRPCG